MGYTAILSLTFVAIGLLIVYLVEDAIIDRRVLSVAKSIADGSVQRNSVPAGFAVYTKQEAPIDVYSQAPFMDPWVPFEMRRANRRHVHGILISVESGEQLIVLHDVTDLMSVGPNLASAGLAALMVIILLVGLSRLLAKSFAGKISSEVKRLAERFGRAESASELLELASKEDVIEFRRLLELYASAARDREDAIIRERQTLAYLAHELRTPLQSARTSIELILENPSDAESIARIQRAVSRLSRASHAVLMLAKGGMFDDKAVASLPEIVESIAVELRDIASERQQEIRVLCLEDSSIKVHAPDYAVEVVVANLIFNAIQHGSRGVISCEVSRTAITIVNPVDPDQESHGFGIGINVVKRLMERIKGECRFELQPGKHIALIVFPFNKNEEEQKP